MLVVKSSKSSSSTKKYIFTQHLDWHTKELDNRSFFFNKSASNKRTGNKKYGWALIGSACKVSHLLKKSEKWSVLPALAVNRYLSHFILQDSITFVIFEAFIKEQMLPYYSLYPRPHSVLIFNNTFIHKLT